MPASSINLYHMEAAKNNFNAVRPAPLCSDTNSYMSKCQNIHISTNCYYGYHNPKSSENVRGDNDCEMIEIPHTNYNTDVSILPQSKGRKRSAEDYVYSQNKRLREEVQTKKSKEPETTEKVILQTSSEEFLEALYWNIHGGTLCYSVND